MPGWNENDVESGASGGWGAEDRRASGSINAAAPNTALDVAKQAGAGLVEGTEGIPAAPARFLGAIGDVANRYLPSWMVNQDKVKEQENLKNIIQQNRGQGIANYLPEPQTTAGQYARTGASFIPSALGAPGGVAGNIAAGVTGGLASEAAGQAAEGTDYELPARIAGAVAGTHSFNVARQKLANLQAYHGAPTQRELEDSVNTRHSDLRNLGVQYRASSVSNALKDIRGDITNSQGETIHENAAPRVYDLLKSAEREYAPTAEKSLAPEGISPEGRAYFQTTPGQQKPHVSFDQIKTLRSQLGDLTSDATEATAARSAQRGIDRFLATIDPNKDIVSGNGLEAARLAKLAREESSANFRMRAMEGIRERAELSPTTRNGNPERAYRNELAGFIRPNRKGVSPAMREGFNKQEIDEIRQAAKVGKLPAMLRIIGMAGGHLGLAGLGGATYFTHDPRYAEAGALAWGARRMGAVLARARMNRAARAVASRSPLAREQGVRTASPASQPYMSTLGTIAGPSATQFKQGGRVKRSFSWRP